MQLQGWSYYQDKDYSWSNGTTQANNDIILWKWGYQKWIETMNIESKPTKYSDHKAFSINIQVDMDIIPIQGNNR